MPRVPKYDEVPFEKWSCSGKCFIYISQSWDILYPYIDVLRLLKKNTIVRYRYGKNQQNVLLYSTQYNHRVIGTELKTKQDYNNLQRARIDTFFIFSDNSDPIATNLLKCAEQFKTNAVCYSNLDKLYHFYNYTGSDLVKKEFKKPEEVIEMMYLTDTVTHAKKMDELFPEFEILENIVAPVNTNLEDCIKALKITETCEKKKKERFNCQLFDPHTAKLKKMEYERAQKKIVYTDDIEIINKNVKKQNDLARFFKK